MPVPEQSRILKAESIRGLGSKIVFNYEDVRKRCDEHLEKVQQQAAGILQQAHDDAQALRVKTFHEAKQLGIDEGLKSAHEEIESRARQIAEQLVSDKLATTLPAVRQAAQ